MYRPLPKDIKKNVLTLVMTSVLWFFEPLVFGFS
jgi:hypothetical protein